MNYRPEIDGLRAIAVFAVMLYHAELNILGHHFFEGGYLGVDIFFVISGYLITNIILSELYETGSFSFKNFYERRARRILPMLFFVMLVSIPFAWKILLPSAFIEFAESIFTSIFFSSNFYFYFTTTEYGAETSLLKPLLHTWSLGVEEQFYLIFPILALAAFKYAKQYLLQILFLLLLGSLFYAEFMGQRNSELNFFLPLSRVWELAVGSLLAYKAVNYKENINNFWHQLLPLLGLFLIFYSFYLFQEKTNHPGLITIIPIIGTALIISYSSSSEFVGKLLSTKPMVGMGLISYSTYLWHFPIFAFYRNLDVPETLEIKFALILSTIILSVITYIIIEKPFRNKNKLPLKKIISIFTIIFLFFMAFIISTKINKGFENRFPKIQGFENFELDNGKLRKLSWSITKEKRIFDEGAINKILIIGNSHGKDFFNAMYQNKERIKNTDFIFENIEISCFDISKINLASKQKNFFESKSYKDSNTIIISSRFPIKFENQNCGGSKSKKSGNIKKGFKNFILKTSKDNKNIIFLGNTVEFKKLEKKWIQDFIYQKYKNNDVDVNYEFFLKIQKETNKSLYKNKNNKVDFINKSIIELTSKSKIKFFDKVKIICDDKKKECSGLTDEGYKTFYDYGHWTLEGAKYFGKKFLEDKDFIKLLELK